MAFRQSPERHFLLLKRLLRPAVRAALTHAIESPFLAEIHQLWPKSTGRKLLQNNGTIRRPLG
jgi:hypothetical protein